MARKRFHGLKKMRLRQTFSKYNLFNLSRSKPENFRYKTFFQQKWLAKAETRSYHGETIREKQWTRMFARGTSAVMPMDPKHLAEYDGSQQAEGRGGGADTLLQRRKSSPKIPFMNMASCFVIEDVDFVCSLALFASSTRQARQFVVHGDVKVNGKKMVYPGYQLNPGDMFQVEPERVLYALGAPKDKVERHIGRKMRLRSSSKLKAQITEAERTKSKKVPDNSSAGQLASSTGGTAATTRSRTPKERLQFLLDQAKILLSTPSTALAARQKRDLRSFQRSVKRSMSRPNDLSTSSLDTQLQEIVSQINPAASESSDKSSAVAADTPLMSSPSLQAEAASLTPAQMHVLRNALKRSCENPVDPRKPYATPWRPRDYLSPFAFIPNYLEVHQKICSAVYLRHPVARPGLAEVPTPFNPETLGLAHNWYLRRR